EIQRRGKTDGPKHPQLVFGHPIFGIPNCSNDLSFEISLTSDEVVYCLSQRIKEQPVDCEIATLCIFLGTTELHMVWSPPIEIRSILTKRGNFNRNPSPFRPQNNHDP